MQLIRILIAEDDPKQSAALSELVQLKITETLPLNFQIDIVTTLEEALRFAPTANVTLLDLQLADATTDEVVEAIPLFRPPVIIMTGSDDPELHTRCKILGAEYVFLKGSARGLMRAILHALSKDILASSDLGHGRLN